MKPERDWAIELIEEMDREGNICDYEAGRAFRAAYANGDSVDAVQAMSDGASAEVDASNEGYEGTNTCYLFSDGSCYCDWNGGLDRFFPDADMLADEERESDPELAEKIDAAYAAVTRKEE